VVADWRTKSPKIKERQKALETHQMEMLQVEGEYESPA
jgi:hypothetical protein